VIGLAAKPQFKDICLTNWSHLCKKKYDDFSYQRWGL